MTSSSPLLTSPVLCQSCLCFPSVSEHILCEKVAIIKHVGWGVSCYLIVWLWDLCPSWCWLLFTDHRVSLTCVPFNATTQIKTLVSLLSFHPSIMSSGAFYLSLWSANVPEWNGACCCAWKSTTAVVLGEKRRGSTSFASARGEGGRCIFSSHVIIVAR